MWYHVFNLAVAVVVGLAVGLYFRKYNKPGCEKFGAWALSIDWRLYAVEAVAFGLLGALQISYGNHVFAAAAFGLTALAVATSIMQYRRQRTSPDNPA
jgi:large-conductance mechanosensitive channel